MVCGFLEKHILLEVLFLCLKNCYYFERLTMGNNITLFWMSTHILVQLEYNDNCRHRLLISLIVYVHPCCTSQPYYILEKY